jgi:hypothetical protein
MVTDPPSASRTTGDRVGSVDIEKVFFTIAYDSGTLGIWTSRLSGANSRIGFEASNHYDDVPLDLVEKVVNCEWALERMEEKHART